MNSLIANRCATLLRASAARAVAGAPRTMASGAVAPSNAKASLSAGTLAAWYNMFGKSTAQYASWLIVVVLVGEAAFGAGRDALWESLNAGHTYKSTDWSKFDQFGEDDDDDDDEDDDDDDDDDE